MKKKKKKKNLEDAHSIIFRAANWPRYYRYSYFPTGSLNIFQYQKTQFFKHLTLLQRFQIRSLTICFQSVNDQGCTWLYL